MRYVAVIQARYDSSRLRGKVLTEIAGKTVLQHVIDGVRRSKNIDEIVVATSIEKSNLPIVALCAELGVRVYVGSEADVLDRYYQVCRLLNPQYIIRVTGDCPLFDGTLLDLAIESLLEFTDYLGMLSETFADGLDLEIIRAEALKKAWREAELKSQREHVTQYIIHHPELFVLQDFTSPIGNFGHQRWTLDEEEDLIVISSILNHFYDIGKPDFSYIDVLNYLNHHPEIAAVNKMYRRNEGLEISLQNDYIVSRTEE